MTIKIAIEELMKSLELLNFNYKLIKMQLSFLHRRS